MRRVDAEILYVFSKYTLPLRGVKNIDKYMVGNMGSKTIFDYITSADEAYCMWLFQHGYDFWKERNQDLRAERIQKRKDGTYLVQHKKWAQKNRNGYADCGISEEGLAVYKNLLTKTVARRNNTVHMQLFQEVWENFSRENAVASYVSSGRKRKRIQKTPEDNDYYVPL